MLKSINIRGVL